MTNYRFDDKNALDEKDYDGYGISHSMRQVLRALRGMEVQIYGPSEDPRPTNFEDKIHLGSCWEHCTGDIVQVLEIPIYTRSDGWSQLVVQSLMTGRYLTFDPFRFAEPKRVRPVLETVYTYMNSESEENPNEYTVLTPTQVKIKLRAWRAKQRRRAWYTFRMAISDRLFPRFLTLEQAKKTRGDIYVMNTVSSSKYKLEGDILIDTNKGFVFTILATWVPRGVRSRFKQPLLESFNFARLVDNNAVRILTKRYAKSLLKTDDAIDECERLSQISSIVNSSSYRNRSILDSKIEIFNVTRD